jgi:hypothetical protein
VRFLLALLVATSVATSLVADPAAEIFKKGETLDYSLTWLKVTGGMARMTVSPKDDDRYRITSVARSSGSLARFIKVRDEIETTVSRTNFGTQLYVKRLDEKGDKHEEVTVVGEGVAARTKNGKTKTVKVPEPVFDPISVIYYFRTLELAPGNAYDMTLISDGKLYTVNARVLRREVVTTPAGRFKTLLVEPKMVNSGVPREERLFIWYTDDERHIPVRIRTEVKFGSVVATLTAIRSGASAVEPPLPR